MPDLIAALKDPDPVVRQGVAAALGGLGALAAGAVPALIETLQDPDPGVRRNAASSLGRLGAQARGAIPALIAAVKDSDPAVRASAASSLGSLHNIPAAPRALRVVEADPKPSAIPAFIEALQDPTPSVRWSAASSLGRLGAQARGAIPALIAAVKHPDPDTAHIVAGALAEIATALYDAEATDMIGPLTTAHDALADRGFDSEARSVRRAVKSLKSLWWGNLTEGVRQWIHGHPYWSAGVAVYLALLLCWLIFYGIRPLWLYRINEALKPYTDFALPKELGGIKVPLRYVLFVGFFHYSRRVLDAWITQHLPTAREEFQRKATVSERAVHIPVPVILNGQAIPHLTVEHLRPTFDKSRVCLLIWGEGGSGKTSLACQVARWAMADMPTERLCPQHRMLPVLIEQALEPKDKDHPLPFTDALRGELRALTHEEDPIPEEFLLRLLQRRRVLVIVDHFSEMPEATRQEIRPGQPEFPANALVVTSRLEERLGGVQPTMVKPLRIQGNRLSSFLEAYLTQRGKREYFDDAEFFEACHRLSLMVGTRDITVLLAKLYAEQMIAAKEGSTDGNLPETIPDLMLSYVNEVNRGVESHKQDDRLVHRVAKVIAWECLQRTYHPTSAPRQAVLAALAGEQDAEAMLMYLENRLRLIQTWGVGRNHIRFTLDPLAEYLAGLHLLDQYGDDADAWRKFLSLADAMPGAPDAIKEFLLAVCDCCLARGSDAKVPNFLPDELTNRAGVDAEVAKSAGITISYGEETITI